MQKYACIAEISTKVRSLLLLDHFVYCQRAEAKTGVLNRGGSDRYLGGVSLPVRGLWRSPRFF